MDIDWEDNAIIEGIESNHVGKLGERFELNILLGFWTRGNMVYFSKV